jgi:hypothetical protein
MLWLWTIVSNGAYADAAALVLGLGCRLLVPYVVIFSNSVAPEVLSLDDQRFCERYRFHGLLLLPTQS